MPRHPSIYRGYWQCFARLQIPRSCFVQPNADSDIRIVWPDSIYFSMQTDTEMPFHKPHRFSQKNGTIEASGASA